jgi:hypothetical protein
LRWRAFGPLQGFDYSYGVLEIAHAT